VFARGGKYRVLGLTFASLWLVIVSLSAARSQEHEKVAEGKYGRFKNGLPAEKEPSQSWTLWRTAQGGFELVDQFVIADPAAQIALALGPKLLSREMRQELQGEVEQDELDVTLSPQKQPESLRIRGKRLDDGKPIDIVTCSISDKETICKGVNGDVTLKSPEAHRFFFSFPFPMLLISFLKGPPEGSGQVVAMKLAGLELGEKPGKDKLRLVECDGKLTFLGQERYPLGTESYHLNKYSLEIRRSRKSQKPLNLTVWALPNGLVVAMESNVTPVERLQLVQYQKYSDF
jgi:hypothetical protein